MSHEHPLVLKLLHGNGTGRDQAAALAELQKASAWALRNVVDQARRDGASWRELAAALDMPPMTLHRQFRAGRGLVVSGELTPVVSTTAEQLAQRVTTAVPVAADRFVGRERELADLHSLKSRLVTLTGPGGVGKTRLAAEFTAGSAQWVDLTPLSDDTLVEPAVAAMFGGRPLEDALAGEPLLIVLDNCEHVIDGCAALVGRLLSRCPRLRVLATSREALQIPGESVFPVTPLDLPAAVRLFADRARAADPAFESTGVAELCARLDGLPLAIELAARQILPPDRLLREQDRRLDLLAGGRRTGPQRHRSLRSAIRWSYDLLTPAEQRVFRALSVLPGGFDEPLAAAMTRENPLWTVLTALAAKSLVTAEATGRFRILESLRIFGIDRLDAEGERDAVEERVLVLAARFAEAMLLGTENRELIAHADAERHNLHYALTVAERRGDCRVSLLGAALALCWTRRGEHRLARPLAERLLARAEPGTGQACLYSVLAIVCCMQGCPADALAAAERARALSGARPELAARAFAAMSRAHSALGDHEAAVEADLRQVALLRELPRPFALATALNDLAWALLMAGRPGEAREHVEESLTLLDGNPEALGTALHTAGTVALLEDRFDQATTYFTRSLSMSAADTDTTLYNLEGLAMTAAAGGDLGRAHRLVAARASTQVAAVPWWTTLLGRFIEPSPATVSTVEEALRCARQDTAPAATGVVSCLTGRERQVADGVAAGLTDRQIAARLGVSPRTVAGHLAKIREKLDLPTRIHVATWLLEKTRA